MSGDRSYTAEVAAEVRQRGQRVAETLLSRPACVRPELRGPVDRLVRGMPVRGLKSVLSIRQSAFGSEGELYLFSTVLAHFFSLYASVNAFHLLEVVNLDNKERYQWPVQIGQHSLM